MRKSGTAGTAARREGMDAEPGLSEQQFGYGLLLFCAIFSLEIVETWDYNVSYLHTYRQVSNRGTGKYDRKCKGGIRWSFSEM